MLRVNKASEYGVLALGLIGTEERPLSARQIADGLHLPYEITAKTLQRLKEEGIIDSSMGTNGGYKLVRPLSEISFAQVIKALEGPVALVECSDHSGKECLRNGSCGLKGGMLKLNGRLNELLESIKINELVSDVEQKIS
jgi:Rrf2 family protein